MSEEMAMLQTGVSGAEEEAKSVLGTLLAQIITLVRNIINYALHYMSLFVEWAGKHPLASILLITNFSILIS